MVESLFYAYFIEGLDTGDIDTLAEIASRAGFDRVSARRDLASDAGTAEVRGEQDRAHRLGIHAVPCFVLEHGYAISGAQEPEIFLPLFDLTIRSGGRAATKPGPHHSTIPIYGR